MSATHRTLLHTRAANVQSYKLHAMEETYYWRCIAGDQLQDHCERVIRALNQSDINPFHPVLYDLRSAIWKNLNRQALNEGQLLTRKMIDRDIAAQAIYGDFLQKLSHLNHLYSPPLTGDSQPRSPSRTPTQNPRQRFSLLPLTDGPGTLSYPCAMSSALDPPSPQLQTPLLTLTTLRKESANAPSSTVSAVINDSQDSSSTIPNNSTRLSDVPHQYD